ncbi:unnamed protein product [Absidia cylindrospora]
MNKELYPRSARFTSAAILLKLGLWLLILKNIASNWFSTFVNFCFKYMNNIFVVECHKVNCHATQPHGNEIYRGGTISLFEVGGRKNKVYCQNLCLLVEMFPGSQNFILRCGTFLLLYDDRSGRRRLAIFQR